MATSNVAIPTASQSAILPVPDAIVSARALFLRDLPQLLQTHNHQWVAYSATEKLGIDATSQTRLVQECLNRGYPRGTFLICAIEPQVANEIDIIPDV
jgi:hypothetical protein